MSISIIIPAYEQHGHGAKLLTELLNSIKRQTITCTHEVIVSDSSRDGSIKPVCDQFPFVTYKVNPRPTGAADNINFALSLANYDKVKLMCQDDLFLTTNAIDLFNKALDSYGWVISNSQLINGESKVTGMRHTRYEHNNFKDNITGMPSVTAFRKCDIMFNPVLKTVVDMYFYHQLYERYGQPGVIKQFTIGQRYHNASTSRNQPSYHIKDVNYLIRNKMIAGTLPKVVVAVVMHDRVENLKRWIHCWKQCEQSAELVIIHNDNGEDYSAYCEGVTYIRRMNPTGFDIGALQDVCKKRLPGLPDFDYLLWCTDDTVPMAKDFVNQFIDSFSKKIGCVCMHLSGEITPHIRTTGFCITRQVAESLVFPSNHVSTKQQCFQFEYKGSQTLMKQIVGKGLRIAQVAPLYRSPLYDMNFWCRNDYAIMLRHLLDRQQEHDEVFGVEKEELILV